MSQEYGFLVDLQGLSFDEGSPAWIQAFPLGKWNHPVYGEIDVTPEKVTRMAANVKANVRGQDLDIDYDHKATTSEAAGWVKDADARTDGLWLSVEWTKEALGKIKDRAYRYFSPEYTDEWEHPSSKVKYKDVLFGGGITNRPFLKGILPLNLSEAFADEPKVENTGGTLDTKKILELLKLNEDATDEQVTTKLSELMEPVEPVAPVEPKTDPQVQALAESDPLVKGLVEKIATLEAANRLSEVNLALKEVDEVDGSFAIAPATLAEARTIALEAPKAVGDKVIALLKEMKKTGVVDLREHAGGKGNSTSNSGDTATKRFNDAVEKVATDRKLSYADAATAVSGEEPELFDEYRNESYTRERGA